MYPEIFFQGLGPKVFFWKKVRIWHVPPGLTESIKNRASNFGKRFSTFQYASEDNQNVLLRTFGRREIRSFFFSNCIADFDPARPLRNFAQQFDKYPSISQHVSYSYRIILIFFNYTSFSILLYSRRQASTHWPLCLLRWWP